MKNMPASLDQREFAEIDRHFARWVSGFGGPEAVAVACAALSRNLRMGHICLDLTAGPLGLEDQAIVPWLPKEELISALKENRAIGNPESGRPLVIDAEGRLYLRRYWEYENSVARAILARCEAQPASNPGSDDLQERAVEAALQRRFVVISGGPGTGKTTTVWKILERMIAQPGGEFLRVALAAPTGKAAARLEESLRGDGRLNNRLEKTACTLHRLLGTRPGSASPRHHAGNPLPVDVMVVDEASMVPLTMMAKLLDALPAKARVILLGDSNQLSSVEPGYVLGDIAGAASIPGSPLDGALVALRKNHRFGSRSAIFALSSAVRDGRAQGAFDILGAGERGDLVSAPTPAGSQLMRELKPRILAGYSASLRESDPAEALKRIQQFRVLCALRSGPYGVEAINRKIEAILRAEGLVSGTGAPRGMPVLITRNDPALHLFNGDTGILLPGESGAVAAWFAGDSGGLRHFAPARLPAWEPAFAMTVHKSQGSEYDNVLLVLPPAPNPVCTRELVYTGLTRARRKVELWFREAALRTAVESPVRRSSGLREKLGGRDA